MMKKKLLLLAVLSMALQGVQAQSVFIVTDDPQLEAPDAGNLGAFLAAEGYAVTVDPGIEAPGQLLDDDSAFHDALSADQIAELESHDLVIFHRSTNSGDFNVMDWNNLNVPLWNGSAFTARNDPGRWNWVNGAQSAENSEFLFVNESDHPIFTNVTIENDFVRLFTEPQDYNSLNTAGDVGNGLLLAETELNFLTAIAVWEGSGQFVPNRSESHADTRIYFSLSRYFEDDGSGLLAFDKYSEDGLQLIRNTVEFAIFGDVQGRTPTGGGASVTSWSLFE